MTDRGIAVLAGAIVLAAVVGGFLVIGALGTQPERRGEFRSRFFFGDRPPPAARTIEQVQDRVPQPLRALVAPQRQVAGAFREAAGYLLLVLAVAAALVFGRDQVVAAYRASLGGWRAQARVLALGIALLAIIASAVFLSAVVLLGSLAGPAGPVGPGGPGALGALLQLVVTAVSVVAVIVAIVALVGFAAASWRLGDAIVSIGPLARIGQAAPSAIVALLGATVVYVLTQLPAIGPLIALVALAYAIGSAATARIAHVTATPAGP